MAKNRIIVLQDTDEINGEEVQVRAVQSQNGYLAEWSFDGTGWSGLSSEYDTPEEALEFARCGAFLAHVHQTALQRLANND